MKKVIPFGDRILVKRKKAVEVTTLKEGIVLPDTAGDKSTDLAVVKHIPEVTFTDKKLIEESEAIIEAQVERAKQGDPDSFRTLFNYNHYLKLKMLRVGDEIFMSKYVGVDFYDSGVRETLTMVSIDDILGIVVDECET